MNGLVQPPRTKVPAGSKGAVRSYDADRSMADILTVATAEFADKGLSGARVDAIADATATSKRMIYYHFGSKEGLYLAVLEESYRRIREIESNLNLEDLAPEDALRKLVAFTFDYQQDNEAFIRLVMNENMHRGAYLAQSKSIQDLNVPAIDAVRRVYQRGVQSQAFRRGIDPDRPAHVDLGALLLQRRQSPHLLADLQARPFRTGRTAGAARQHRRDDHPLRASLTAAVDAARGGANGRGASCSFQGPDLHRRDSECAFKFVTGLRTSKSFGLHWSDVDLAGKRVPVHRAIVRSLGRLDTKTNTGTPSDPEQPSARSGAASA
jgi:AcrR family transcriptional regulator